MAFLRCVINSRWVASTTGRYDVRLTRLVITWSAAGPSFDSPGNANKSTQRKRQSMSTSLKILFSVVLALSLGSAFACTEGASGCEIDKKEWVEYVKGNMPLSFCSAGSPFVKCSDVSQAQCRKVASSAANECLAELDKAIPLLLNRMEAVDRGEGLGDCMGRKLFKTIKIRGNKHPDCAGML